MFPFAYNCCSSYVYLSVFWVPEPKELDLKETVWASTEEGPARVIKAASQSGAPLSFTSLHTCCHFYIRTSFSGLKLPIAVSDLVAS